MVWGENKVFVIVLLFHSTLKQNKKTPKNITRVKKLNLNFYVLFVWAEDENKSIIVSALDCHCRWESFFLFIVNRIYVLSGAAVCLLMLLFLEQNGFSMSWMNGDVWWFLWVNGDLWINVENLYNVKTGFLFNIIGDAKIIAKRLINNIR
jgi:hypothetical protein